MPKNNKEIEALELYCLKNEAYIPEAFPNIVSYYFERGSYEKIDDFMVKLISAEDYDGDTDEADIDEDSEDSFDIMDAILKARIREELPVKAADWDGHPDSPLDESFVLYALEKEDFYKDAAWILVKHYCMLGKFEEAYSSIEKIKEIGDNTEVLERLEEDGNEEEFQEELQKSKDNIKMQEELENYTKGYTTIYARDQFKKGEEYIDSGDRKSAVPCYQQAVKYCPENQEYIIALLELELELEDYSLAKSEICTTLKKNLVLEEETAKKLQEIEKKCMEGLTEEMSLFYEAIKEENAESCMNKPSAFAKRDQFGLGLYHYAVLLKKSELIAKLDYKPEAAKCGVGDYDIRWFAGVDSSNEEEVDLWLEGHGLYTFIELLKLYDADAIKLYKDYKWQKAGETVKRVGSGIASSFLNEALGNAKDADKKLRNMQRDSDYELYQEEIQEKRDEIREKRSKIEEMRKSMEKSMKTGNALEVYRKNLHELAMDKIDMFNEQLNASVDSASLASKFVYMVIKKPLLLEDVFYGDKSSFVLHEENGEFWYIPKKLLDAAQELSVGTTGE